MTESLRETLDDDAADTDLTLGVEEELHREPRREIISSKEESERGSCRPELAPRAPIAPPRAL